jgi:hypothetical protein
MLTWGTQWCLSRECGYQFSSEFDSRNRETVPQMRSVNFVRKQNEAEFLDVIVNFSSQIVSVSPAWVARATMKVRPSFVRYWKRVGANCHQSFEYCR